MTPGDDILQLAYPARLDALTGLKLVTQDSAEDIQGTALAVLRTPLGHHDSEPDLGLPEVTGLIVTPDELAQLAVDVTTHFDARAQTISEGALFGMLDQVQAVTAGG